MILLFLQKYYLFRPFVLSMTYILPRDPTLKSRPSPSFLGLGFRLRSRCYSLNNIIIKINNNRRKTLFTAYALSAQDDSAGNGARPYRSIVGDGASTSLDKRFAQTIIFSGERTVKKSLPPGGRGVCYNTKCNTPAKNR